MPYHSPLSSLRSSFEEGLRQRFSLAQILPTGRQATTHNRVSHKSEGGGISGVHVPEGAFSQIIGHSPVIRCLVKKARTFSGSHSAVMIMGETGTGKEVFARAIHHDSARRAGPFIPVNCATFPPDLVENELFGHLPGAFTGASRSHKGLVEQAHGGTLFLDEIDSPAVAIQAKLLRFA